jgi:hypothetical protein
LQDLSWENDMRMRSLLMAAFLACWPLGGARADAVEDLFRTSLVAGSFEQGAGQLKALSSAEPRRAAAAAGLLRFAAAVEKLGQSFYTYGLEAPGSRRGGPGMLPLMRMPVPVNPSPEKIDYGKFRAMLEQFVRDADAAEADLALLDDEAFKLPLDLAAVHFDFDRNGKVSAGETLPDILVALLGPPPGPLPKGMVLQWDTADIYWLRGYGRFLSGFAQFLLAHDFQTTFDKTFHVFFPGAGLATGDLLAANRSGQAPADAEIGDAIAFIHLINWPVTDKTQLGDARLRWVAMTELSPLSWKAARAETDNDGEWLPNAKQTQAFTGTSNDDELIDGWLAVMGELGDVLEGRKLVRQGHELPPPFHGSVAFRPGSAGDRN